MSSPAPDKSTEKPAVTATAVAAEKNPLFERLRQEHASCVAAIDKLEASKSNTSAARLAQAEELERQAKAIRTDAQKDSQIFDILIAAEHKRREHLESVGNELIQKS